MAKFYQQGLNFECTGCGECCRLPGGKVEITPEEARTIAHYLRLEYSDFTSRFCSGTETGYHLLDNWQGHCIFLQENGCRIYPVRPLQCRTFPFWPENLKSHSRWRTVGEFCPGINSGNLYSFHQIREICGWQRNRDEEVRNRLLRGRSLQPSFQEGGKRP